MRRTGAMLPAGAPSTGSPAYDAAMSEPPAPKTVAESRVELTQLMEATDVNIAGTVHGGVVMRLVDTAAGLAAMRHACGLAVTVTIDEMTFLDPVHIGDLLVLRASVNDVGTTSMECGVRVEAHDVVTGTTQPREHRLPRLRGGRRRGEPTARAAARGRDRGGAASSA